MFSTFVKLDSKIMIGCWFVVSFSENVRGAGFVIVKEEDTFGSKVSGYSEGNVSKMK
jgi:hypothetical protein